MNPSHVPFQAYVVLPVYGLEPYTGLSFVIERRRRLYGLTYKRRNTHLCLYRVCHCIIEDGKTNDDDNRK